MSQYSKKKRKIDSNDDLLNNFINYNSNIANNIVDAATLPYDVLSPYVANNIDWNNENLKKPGQVALDATEALPAYFGLYNNDFIREPLENAGYVTPATVNVADAAGLGHDTGKFYTTDAKFGHHLFNVLSGVLTGGLSSIPKIGASLFGQGNLGLKDTTLEDQYAAMNQYVSSNLEGEALDFWNSLSDSQKQALINEGSYSDNVKNIGNFWGAARKTTKYDLSELVDDLNESISDWGGQLTEPTRNSVYNALFNEDGTSNDAMISAYLDELSDAEQRQTALYQDQLKENQTMFDDYRSQVLGNQYRQNAQLMGTVESAMDKSRRNALEAGASAGLRMAENINTTLALQNKQSQISLETSNQLAQQLLNQRQAAAGIRSDYNQMLSNNAAERRGYKEQAVENRYNEARADYDKNYNERLAGMSSDTNPVTSLYSAYQQKNKGKSQYNQGG